VLDMMKGYLQLAAGLGEMSRRKAMDTARELVEGSPVGGMLPGNGGAVSADAVAAQVTAVADELMAIGRQNRRLITQLVRTETQAVLASLGAASPDDGTAAGALERQLRTLRRRVDDLEQQLRERAGAAVATTAGVVRRPGSVASWTSPGSEVSASRTARPGTAKRAAAKRAGATTASATKATAKKATAKKAAPAKKATAKKTTAKKAAE
jgi:hypothetical protein